MPSLDLLGNLDVWSEVLKYLEISFEFDSESEVKDKRRALLRVALLSPSLTTSALDVLWQSMTSIEPITCVINAKASTVDENIIKFLPENSGGYWWLKRALNSDDLNRAWEYLARIRHLRTQVGVVKEMGLYATLSHSFGGVVLPSVQSLCFDFSKAGYVSHWINTIGPLLSSTLKSISYQNVSASHAGGVDTLQAGLKSRSLSIIDISYHGYPSSSLLQNCLSFDSLETLKLISAFSGSSIPRYTAGSSIFEAFESLPKLKELEVDLRVFPLRNSTIETSRASDTFPKTYPSPSLINLHIAGDASDIAQFLLNGIKSLSLLSLSVTIFQTNGLVWKVVCDRIVSNFPKLRSLCFRRAGGGIQQLLMQDLSALLSRTTVESFELSGIPHCFNEANISGMLDSWPKLHTLSITNDTSTRFSATVLIRISHATHLRHVKLPLELSVLGTPLPEEPVAVSRSLVQALTMTSISGAPSSLESKIEVASNLLILFPILERLFTDESHHSQYLGELEKLVGSFRRMVVTYLRRRELEERTTKKTEPSRASKEDRRLEP
ncbi:hypothetical protein D9756_008522 [Leucocoprinus leucothites]|uniref:Uncharacterized protein n=1 Tax=Leucocoprinus leucothites TaxID=201217 RepID=A0A8H5FVH3_9AGAR|nr:hypothetical protein D9756_008522 [Leucoagaricus leucothites]